MRAIVTGSDGYIGSNLCISLRNLGYEVMGLDRVSGNDLLLEGMDDKIRSFRPDWIIHLAALPSIIACEENKEQATIDNVETAELISDIAAEIGCLVMFSSSQAAKNPESSHYAWCKNESEKLLNSTNAGYILRFSNIYGGRKYVEKKNSVMAQFVKAYKNNKPLIANGDGTQGRDFLHMDDLSEVIISLMEVPTSRMHTIDIGTGIPTSIKDIIELFDCPYVLNPDSSNVGLESNFADVSLMNNLIGYYPKPRMKEWIEEIKND